MIDLVKFEDCYVIDYNTHGKIFGLETVHIVHLPNSQQKSLLDCRLQLLKYKEISSFFDGAFLEAMAEQK